jgi:hypothetical protein
MVLAIVRYIESCMILSRSKERITAETFQVDLRWIYSLRIKCKTPNQNQNDQSTRKTKMIPVLYNFSDLSHFDLDKTNSDLSLT